MMYVTLYVRCMFGFYSWARLHPFNHSHLVHHPACQVTAGFTCMRPRFLLSDVLAALSLRTSVFKIFAGYFVRKNFNGFV